MKRLAWNRLLWIGLALCVAAAVEAFWLAPLVNRMPASGVDETRLAAQIRSRDTPAGPWTHSSLVARRVDRMLVGSGHHVVVQGDLHWSHADGTPSFEASGIYGVDRHTRANLAGYGDSERSGQFLFPLHTERREYRYWDPVYVGPRSARFEREDEVAGLAVLVFRFTTRDLDETAGYIHLADVPERYRARTDAEGRLWIEPTSGIVVDYEDRGTSFFVERKTAARVADFYHWTARYDAGTRAAKLTQARQAKRRIVATESVIPAALLLAGVPCLLGGALQLRRRLPIAASARAA